MQGNFALETYRKIFRRTCHWHHPGVCAEVTYEGAVSSPARHAPPPSLPTHLDCWPWTSWSGAFLTGSPPVSRHLQCGVGFLNSWPAGSAFLHTSHPPLFLPRSLSSLLSLQRFQIVQVARSNPSFLLVSREARPSLALSRNCFFLLWSAPFIISISLSPCRLSLKSPLGVQLVLLTKAAATEGPWLLQLSSVACAVSLSFCSEWGLAGHGSCHPAIKRSHHLPFKHAQILQIPYVLVGPRGHHAKWNKSEKDKYWMISLICGIHKSWTQKHRVAWWLPGAGVGNQVDAGHRVPISSSEMSKSGGPNVEHAD